MSNFLGGTGCTNVAAYDQESPHWIILVPAVLVDTPTRIGILFVCFSCVHSTRHVIEVIAGALDVQKRQGLSI